MYRYHRGKIQTNTIQKDKSAPLKHGSKNNIKSIHKEKLAVRKGGHFPLYL